MATFQPTKKKTSSDVFQPTSRKTYDTTVIYDWEMTNKQALDIINDYNSRINKSEWLDKEDRAKYRSALDSYIETANLLRGINKTFGKGYSDEDEKKWSDSIASMYEAYDSTDKYYSQWIDEKDYKGQRDGWFQKSNQFDDGYQFGDVTKTVVGSLTDIGEKFGAGLLGIGEAAVDAFAMMGQAYNNQILGESMQSAMGFAALTGKDVDEVVNTYTDFQDTSKEATAEFVKKDLYNEGAVAKAIIANPVKALTGIDAETDSVFGAKTDSLAQSAGQLGGTAALQAVGVPWWVTTGVTAFGSESENAFNQGATYEEAALSGLVSAGAEILTEKISGGIRFGGKTLDDFLPSLTANISNKVVRKLLDLGIDMVGEGGEEILSGVLGAIGQKLTYASDKEIGELFSSEDVLDSFIGGAVLGFGGSVIKNAKQTIDSNKQAIKKYGNGAELVTETLGIDSNNAFAQKMQGKIDKGKSLSGGQINRLVEAKENALVSQDKGKMKSAVEARLAELGESGDVSKLADVIVKAQSGGKLTTSERNLLAESKYGRRVSTELNPKSIESGEYSSSWAESIGTERINSEAYNKGLHDLASEQAGITVGDGKPSVTNNTSSKENATESDVKRSVAKATMTDSEGNEVEVKPQRFASTESGEMGIEIEGGKVVNIAEIDFGDSDMGLVRQAAVDMSSRVGGFSVDTANVFVRGYDEASGQNVGEYIDGWISSYKFGAMKNPPPISALAANPITAQLTEEQRKTAYNFGRAFGNEAVAKNATTTNSEKIDSTVSINADKDSQKTVKKGRVISDGAIHGKHLNERQKASLKALNFLAKALGKDIYVEDIASGENGWYDPEDRSIHIDLNAGALKEALLLFTTAHELSHDIRATLPEKFNTLATAVFEEYNKRFGDHTMEDLINAKIDFLTEKGTITEDMTEEEAYDLAYEEVICDCLETMLVDSDAMEALSKNIYAKDKGLWQKIKDFFERLVERIKAAYEDAVPDSEEGQRFRDLGEGAERIKKLWVEAIVELSEVDKATGTGEIKHSYSSIAHTFFGDKKVTVKDFESGSYTETEGYKRYVEQCLNNMSQSVEGFNEKSALKEIRDSIDGIVKVAVAMKKAGYDILDNHAKRSTVDSKNRLLFSSLEPNSDYFTSSDISTICDKRINFAEIYDEIVRREEALGVPVGKRFFNNVDNYFILHKIMADKGLTQPCRQCYVESMRKNLAPMAKAFLKLMQETDPNNTANDQLFSKGKPKPNNTKLREKLLETIEAEEYEITADKLTVEMLTTEDGLAQLKLQAPLIYEAFNSFYGQSKPKMPKAATPFRFGELTALLTDEKGKIKKGLIDKILSTGGFRLQSYSDFQIQNFADVLQVIFEAGTLGLSGHAYTKVPAFLDATKGTNLKRNISIFMYNDGGEWKIDRNDSFPYDLEKIYDIVKSDKSGNTGIIAVSQNEMMSAWIMANDNVGYFIPFHKSGMKMGTVRETIVKEGGREIKGYSGIKDHTRQQTEVWAKTTADHKALTKVKKSINIYDFWDFDNADNLSREGLIEKNVRAYIDACNEMGYLPKFREYVTNNSKVLNSVLAYSKQLGFVSQNATIDDISFEYKGYRIPYGYYKCLGDFGMFTPDGEASAIERLSLKDYNFAEAVEFFSNAESLRRNEILQQIANGEERERYRNSDMTTAEIAEEVQAKRNQVVDEVVSGEYKAKKFSDRASEKATFSEDFITSTINSFGIKDVQDYIHVQRQVFDRLLDEGFFTNTETRSRKDVNVESGMVIETNKSSISETFNKDNYKHLGRFKKVAKLATIKMLPEIIKNGKLIADNVPNQYQNSINKTFAYISYDTEIDGVPITVKLDIKKSPSKNKLWVHSIITEKNSTGQDVSSKNGIGTPYRTDAIGEIIPQDKEIVKSKFSHRADKKASYAPTFYSYMGKVIDGIRLDKMGAGGVVSYLKGKGVKDEEIKWSGIEAFLEGKKSVTKAELQEFVAGSQLQIEETNSGINNEAYTELDNLWRENFLSPLEDVFDPEDFDETTVSAQLAFLAEYGMDMPSEDVQQRMIVLAHKIGKPTRWEQYKLNGGTNYRELVFKMPNSSYSSRAMRGHWGQEAEGVLAHARIQDFEVDGRKMLFIEEIQSDWHNEGREKGYSTKEYEDAAAVYDKLAEAYANANRAFNRYVRSSEFNHDPEDVRKKKFDWLRNKMESAEKRMQLAEKDVDSLKEKGMGDVPDAPFRNTYHEYVLKRLLRMAAEEGYDSIGWTTADIQSERWSDEYAEGYRIEYDQDIPKFLRKYGKKWGATVGTATLNDTEVWSMEITDSMKDSVLYEGQVLYQHRATNGMKPRTLLANALETTAQNDVERTKLKQYKEKIDLLNAEEQKLHDLREQIKELSFKKGQRDTEAIKSLQFEANQAANRINTYDRQLLNLESTKALKGVLEREKEQARKRAEQKAEQRRKADIARVKERAAKTERELMNRYQESREKAREGREKTDMRHKIKDIVKELNTLLLNPTAKKHIKEELRKEVADALSAINMDTVDADARVAKYNALIARESDPDIIAELTKTRDNIQLQGEKLKDKLIALQNAYKKIKASEDIELSMSYQEVIHNSIENVTDKVGNTPIRNMTLEQLEMVYDLFKMIRTTIRDANKAFNAKKGETIMQMAEAVNDQVRTVGGQPYKRNVISAAIQRVGWTFLKPLIAFRTIGSITLTNLYKELRNGEDVFYGDVKAAQTFIEEQYEKHNYKSWDMKKTKTFTAKSGKTFDLTLEQMMTLYAYSRREQAHKHIIEGGIVFEDALIVEKNKWGIPIKYEVTTKDAFNLSEETFAEIASSLTAEQKAFVDAMQEYLSTTMGEKGNEVSMQLLGVKLFKEKFYLPIKSSQYYRNFSAEEAGEVKLKSPAFSKETVKHANNPIVLHSFTDLWAEHINNMSMYHAFVLALEDFTRVYNYKTKTDDKVETMDTKATLETAYPGVTKYISKFLKDMNGGVRSETVGGLDKLTSLAKKGSVLGSWSVTIQQPSAVMRAMAMVNPKYFVTTAHKSVNLAKHKKDWAEIKKYAPIAGIKEMGRFDVGMGQETVDWIQSNKTLMEKGEDIISLPPAFMDEVTWVSIWNAVKRETAHNNPKLSTSSEEFFKLAGERFTDVISMTQVYDSVFSRSDLMRNKSWIAKAATAFMAEPTTTLNMIWDAWVQAKRTGGFKAYANTVITTGAPIMASIVLNAALKSIVMAMRDDDEDESYAEKYLESFVGEIKDNLNPLTLVPIAKDIVSIFKGYDVERMDMALFSDLKNAMDAFDSEEKTLYEKWSGLIGAISAFGGVPIKNVERDVRGLLTTIFGKTEDTTTMGILNAIEEGWAGKEISNRQQLYEAMLKGDAEQIERVKGRFKDESAINSAIRKALRENDPRIKEAAEALNEGNFSKYSDILNEIVGEENFAFKDIKAAILTEFDNMTPEE